MLDKGDKLGMMDKGVKKMIIEKLLQDGSSERCRVNGATANAPARRFARGGETETTPEPVLKIFFSLYRRMAGEQTRGLYDVLKIKHPQDANGLWETNRQPSHVPKPSETGA